MENLIIPWSENMSKEELEYKNRGFFKTKGSVFEYTRPTNEELVSSFNLVKNGELSIGCIALCKHAHRNNIYPVINGNKDKKNKIANDFILEFLSKKTTFQNIHKVNNNLIFEMRNELCGMRWYIGNGVSFRGLLEPYATYIEAKRS
jgi:hypothetical protein